MSSSKSKLDMTLPPDLKIKKGTGPIQMNVPVYNNLLPPCNEGCPAGSNIQAWLSLTQEGKFEEAFQEILVNNPMPSIHGRVCYHPCEFACNRENSDDAVSIHAVERFLGDEAIKQGWKAVVSGEPTGKKVLIVGAGPSGLSAAYQLRRRGHEVEIRDSAPVAGGMMRFGIPSYRLPRDILDAEIKRIEDMGVKFVLNSKVENILEEKEKGKFDAVFLAVGAHIGRGVDIPNDDPSRVIDAVSYLRDIGLDKAPVLGKRVIVYGGGNTAMDAARTARRLGGEDSEVMVVYRRDREHIEEIEADSLILALGQNIDSQLAKGLPGVETSWDGVVSVDEHMMTGYKGLFAGGDMVPSDRTVTIGVGHGKKAAKNIDAFLRGEIYKKAPKKPVIKFDNLHLWYKTEAEQTEQPSIELQRRMVTFDEVLGGLNAEEAVYESKRCYSCGNCFECDGCFAACPNDAITRLGEGKGYSVDYSKCTGCSACVLQCPCHAIEMVPVSNFKR